MPTLTSPLNGTDLNNLNQALKQLVEFNNHLSNAKQAGLDTEQFEQQANYYTQALNNIKSTYFPGK